MLNKRIYQLWKLQGEKGFVIVDLWREAYANWVEWPDMEYYWTQHPAMIAGHLFYAEEFKDHEKKRRVRRYLEGALIGGDMPLVDPTDRLVHFVVDRTVSPPRYDYWEGKPTADAVGNTYPAPWCQWAGMLSLIMGYHYFKERKYLDIAIEIHDKIRANLPAWYAKKGHEIGLVSEACRALNMLTHNWWQYDTAFRLNFEGLMKKRIMSYGAYGERHWTLWGGTLPFSCGYLPMMEWLGVHPIVHVLAKEKHDDWTVRELVRYLAQIDELVNVGLPREYSWAVHSMGMEPGNMPCFLIASLLECSHYLKFTPYAHLCEKLRHMAEDLFMRLIALKWNPEKLMFDYPETDVLFFGFSVWDDLLACRYGGVGFKITKDWLE